MLKRISGATVGLVAGLLAAASVVASAGEKDDPRLRYLTPEELRILQSHAGQSEPEPTPLARSAQPVVPADTSALKTSGVPTEEGGVEGMDGPISASEGNETALDNRVQEAKRESIRAAEAAAMVASPRPTSAKRRQAMAVASSAEVQPNQRAQTLDRTTFTPQEKASPEWVQKEQEQRGEGSEQTAATVAPLAPAVMAEAVVPPLRPEVVAAEEAPRTSQTSGRSRKAAIKDALRLMDRLEQEMLGQKE